MKEVKRIFSNWMTKWTAAGLTALLLLTLALFSLSAGGTAEDADDVPALSEDLPQMEGVAVSTVTGAYAEYDFESVEQLDPSEVFAYTDKEMKAYSAADIDEYRELDNGNLLIEEGGVYHLSGSVHDGAVVIDAGDEDDVVLILDGVSITSSETAAILVENCDKLIIYLAEGSQNYLSDSGTAAVDEESGIDAVLFSHDDLVIAGTGSLAVEAQLDNGIHSKDDLLIIDGNISVSSADDGLIGKDSVVISSGSITINADGDGIKASEDEEGSEGFIAVEAGTLAVTAGSDGLQAEGTVLIAGGEISLETGAGSGTSGRGIKAGLLIAVAGGNLTIDSADDSLHSNGVLMISGGTFTIDSGDDAIRADEAVLIEDGEIVIHSSYEGIESSYIEIRGGRVDVTASDDGINGSDGTGSGALMKPGMDTVLGEVLVAVHGGEIVLHVEGDGFDSNGNAVMTGGSLSVYGPYTDREGMIDYNGTFAVSGGTIIAAGSSGMAMAPSEGSEVNSIMLVTTTTLPAGTDVKLLSAEGLLIDAITVVSQSQAVLFAGPEIEAGKNYQIEIGTTMDVSVTADTGSTWINESGMAAAAVGMVPGHRGMRPGNFDGDFPPQRR